MFALKRKPSDSYKTAFPKKYAVTFAVVVSVVLLMPALLKLIGLNFISPQYFPDIDFFTEMTSAELKVEFHKTLAGSFIYSLMAWSSVSISFVCFVLCMIHFVISKKRVMAALIIFLAVSTVTDAYHVLASNYLVYAWNDSSDLIAFTWILGRSSAAFALGLCFLLFFGIRKAKQDREILHNTSVMLTGFVMLTIIYMVFDFSIANFNFTDILYPEAILKRPWELIPLTLFLSALLYGSFYMRRIKTDPLVLILSLSIMPQAVLHLYMAFGSGELFDHYFNCAQFIKLTGFVLIFYVAVFDFYHALKQRDEQFVELEEAQKQNEMKEQNLEKMRKEIKVFSAAMSHDLKAPLRGITFLTECLLEDQDTDLQPAFIDNIKKVAERTQKMSRVVEGLRTYLEIENIKENKEKINLNTFVRDCINEINPPKHIMIEYDQVLPMAFVDRRNIKLILMNLLRNAFSHADPHEGKVTITCSQENDSWMIGIGDNGKGIDPKFQEKIFQMFFAMEDGSRSRLGLGLALVKKTVDKCGGLVWVESVPGLGCTFYFTIPRINALENAE